MSTVSIRKRPALQGPQSSVEIFISSNAGNNEIVSESIPRRPTVLWALSWSFCVTVSIVLLRMMDISSSIFKNHFEITGGLTKFYLFRAASRPALSMLQRLEINVPIGISIAYIIKLRRNRLF